MLIGELATTSVNPKTLRFYASDGLLPEPDRTAAGYRDYPTSAITRVSFIRQAQAAGLTPAQIRQILDIRNGGMSPCQHIAELVDTRLDQVTHRLRELENTRHEPVTLRQRLDTRDPADCPDESICAAIPPPANPEG